MTRPRQLAARIARLQTLLNAQGNRDGIAENLAAIDALRDLRNDVVHGATAMTEGWRGIALVTWKRTVPERSHRLMTHGKASIRAAEANWTVGSRMLDVFQIVLCDA